MMRLRPDIRFLSGRDSAMMTSFRVKRTPTPDQDTQLYKVPVVFPRLGSPRESFRRRMVDKEPNVRMPHRELDRTLETFLADTQHMGLEVGQHNPSVRLLRVAGVGVGESKQNPNLQPGYSRIQIKDQQGNEIVFRMTYNAEYQDGEAREWNRIVIRIDKARLDGKQVHITPEMHREGFVFLTSGMPDILERAKSGDKSAVATVRQETPCATCFNDGHRASGGKEALACSCDQERAKSLQVINARGGINCLMPGIGNGNGSFAQDIEMSTRSSAARRGEPVPTLHETFTRMGKKEDARNEELRISTFVMEHLFQMRDVPQITTLTDSSRKQNVWNTFGSHHVATREPLGVTNQDSPDFHSKVERGYRRSGPLA